MSHAIHPHLHAHGPGCGHTAVKHGDHVDYLHDGHLHYVHDSHADEHVIAVDASNPASCVPHACEGHDASHKHGVNCGHAAVPHGDHFDYWVGEHLHHVHGDHCDHHGALPRA